MPIKTSTQTSTKNVQRVILIILDGVGCGELPDAHEYGDRGSNTLGNLSKKRKLSLKNLQKWGMGHLTQIEGVPAEKDCKAWVGKCKELSLGKDTTSGHWEMAGIVVKKAFQTFPHGFSQNIIDRWVKECDLPGILGNKAASGTEIIKELGEEHLKTKKPILYTSADSVWQVAAHEEVFGLDRLYEICKKARDLCDELGISRVIARPFIGKSAQDFSRTHHRKDYSQTPSEKTMMEYVQDQNLDVIGIGKISNIYAGQGITKNYSTKDNNDGMETLFKVLENHKTGLVFLNLIDFDMNYGHRRDVPGFAKALEDFDNYIPRLESALDESDLVLISADHGNDPTFKGSDHTREYIPMLGYRKNHKGGLLGELQSFADIGQTVLHALAKKEDLLPVGKSFFEKFETPS